MKIAYISIIHEPWGGSEELWAVSAQRALQEGHEVLISAIDCQVLAPKMKALQDAGATIFLRRGYIKPGTPLLPRVRKKAINFVLNRLFNPYRSLFRQKPDVVVFTGACYSFKDEQPLYHLLQQHDLAFYIINQVNYEYGKSINTSEALLIRNAYQRAKKVLFVSQRNLDTAKRHLLDPIEHAVVVRNPVNLADTTALPYPGETFTQMAIVANLLVNHKGHDLLLDVLRKDKWLARKWHLNIYGSGVDESYIKSLVSFFALEDRVSFHGRVSDIRQVWTQNHLLVMPSLCEGIPLAMVEAMLCGRPVVATDVGGNMEWVREGIEGFIAEGAAVHSFDQALERAWDKKDQWAQMGDHAHKRAQSLYDADAGGSLLKLITSP